MKVILAEVACTTVYLMSRCMTSGVHEVTSHENYYGKKPDLSHVRALGSIAYVHIPDEKQQTLEPKLKKCIMGYSLSRKVRNSETT